MLQGGQIAPFSLRLGFWVTRLQGTDQTEVILLLHRSQCSVIAGCLGLTARGQRWVEEKDGHKANHGHLLTGPPPRKSIVPNGIVHVELETLCHINTQACPELVKRQKTNRERMSTLTQFTDCCFSCQEQQKSLPNPEEWKWKRVRGGDTGDRFSPWQETVTPPQL